jgi:hypothetical protein
VAYPYHEQFVRLNNPARRVNLRGVNLLVGSLIVYQKYISSQLFLCLTIMTLGTTKSNTHSTVKRRGKTLKEERKVTKQENSSPKNSSSVTAQYLLQLQPKRIINYRSAILGFLTYHQQQGLISEEPTATAMYMGGKEREVHLNEDAALLLREHLK